MPSPIFTLETSDPGEHYEGAYEESVTAAIYDQAGVDSVTWEIFGTSHDETAPAITLNDAKGYSVEIALPAQADGDGRAYGIRAVINGGKLPGTEITTTNYSATSGVYIANGDGAFPAFLGETFEFDETRGWGPRYNVFKGSALAFLGDVTGTNSLSVVAKLQGIPISTTAPSDGQLFIYDEATGEITWTDVAAPSLGGDATGSITNSTVERVNGATYPAAGSLTTGHVAQVIGGSAVAYALLGNDNITAGANIARSKLANITAGKLSGRTSVDDGPEQAISPSGVLEISGTNLRITRPTAGLVLTGNGSGSDPTFQEPTGGAIVARDHFTFSGVDAQEGSGGPPPSGIWGGTFYSDPYQKAYHPTTQAPDNYRKFQTSSDISANAVGVWVPADAVSLRLHIHGSAEISIGASDGYRLGLVGFTSDGSSDYSDVADWSATTEETLVPGVATSGPEYLFGITLTDVSISALGLVAGSPGALGVYRNASHAGDTAANVLRVYSYTLEWLS